jgi:hypothetical protein
VTTPGSNLFRRAIKLIKPTTIQYYRWNGRTLNAVKQWISDYAPAVTIKASVQSVPRSVYKQFGLELQKQYIKFFAPVDFFDLARDTAGDKVVWNGRLYQINSQTDWFVQDGWASCIAADVGPFTGDPNA